MESVLLRVPDLEASSHFFTQLLGDPVTQGGERWFAVGTSRLGLRGGDSSGVEYIRLTGQPFEARTAVAALTEAGGKQARIVGGNEVEFVDADGYRIRVVPR
jgi:catechol 2,3-dioxygenase-like lactoylglutathione lyase family enzyme